MSMFDNIKFPFLTHQQLNLDWILQEIKRVMGFFPESGDTGTVLMKTEDGTAWEELAAVDININGVPEDTELSDTDKLIFYDISASANRKITAPNLLNSMMSNGTPLMDGTGSAGTSKKPARYDHRHPTDTSRQAALSGVQMAAVNSGAVANSFTNGVLDIAHGGTGGSDLGAALRNLDLSTRYMGGGASYISNATVQDGVFLIFGKRGVNAILSIVIVNLGSASVIDLASTGFITASLVDNKLKITTDQYAETRCISVDSAVYFNLMT